MGTYVVPPTASPHEVDCANRFRLICRIASTARSFLRRDLTSEQTLLLVLGEKLQLALDSKAGR